MQNTLLDPRQEKHAGKRHVIRISLDRLTRGQSGEHLCARDGSLEHPPNGMTAEADLPAIHIASLGEVVPELWIRRTFYPATRAFGELVAPLPVERGEEDFGRLKYAEEEELVLSQLPCWADLTPEQYRQRIGELVEEIEAEALAGREARGVEPLGVEAILRQDPHARPNQTKKSPAPLVHAATKAARERFWEAYSAFVAAFREAADRLKAGDRSARFPLGSFPPALPFVSVYVAQPP